MKKLSLLASLLFALLISTSHATDYYFCDCQSGASSRCVTGQDSNDGLSTITPKQTFKEASQTFPTIAAGDSIQFCRGGSFRSNAKYRWVNFNCSKTNTCAITAFDLPGESSPQLSYPIIIQTSDNHLFALEDGGNADQDEGYNFSNLDLRCTGCTGKGNGFFFYNDADFVTIENISIDGFNIGIFLAGSNETNPGSNGMHDNITINNARLINNKGIGILGGANNLIISNSYFENNGDGTVFDHNLYLSSGNNTIVRGNELYRSSLDESSNCNGVPLVVHGVMDSLLIENNVIREDLGKANLACWGLTVDPAFSKAESFTNITIRGNKIINVGGIGIGVASCDTCLIENNVILQQQSFAITAIKAPNRSRGTGDISLTDVSIKNNSIYISSGGTGIELGTEGISHSIVSNAIHYSGTEKFTCINTDLAAANYTNIDNNTCYFPNALSTSEWEKGSGTSPSALAAWQGISSFDQNSQVADPGFNDPTLPQIDFSAKNISSTIVNFGHTSASSTNDFNDKLRDSTPDAGAFEFGTFNPPAKTNIYLNP